jgi:hypothetical protein
MKFPIVHLSFLPAAGMALFPFIFIKYSGTKNNSQIINHELIHIRQQVELLVVPFYLLYLLNYLINLICYRNHDKAYRNIVFEQEAYQNDNNGTYLSGRRFAAWANYLRIEPKS